MGKAVKPAVEEVVQPILPAADEAAPASDEAAAAVPSPVRVLVPFGFLDDFGDRWFWDAGAVVRNPMVIALLAERCAPTEPHQE